MIRKLLLAVALLFPITAFAQMPLGEPMALPAQGVNGVVYALVVQSDGKILIGGEFSAVGGVPRNNLARLNADGTLDQTFLDGPSGGVNGTVYALVVLPDGSILAGGFFSFADAGSRSNLVRFAADGTLAPTPAAEQSPNGKVYAISVMPDSRVVVGGEFSQIGSQQRKNLAVYDRDFSLLSGPGESPDIRGIVRAVGSTPGSSVVAGGDFVVPETAVRGILLPDEN